MQLLRANRNLMVKQTEESKLQERRCEHPEFEREFRNCFEIDKQRIVHSESFRRLQSKTQVLQVSESNFHRNRLTHSIEVAQIGRSIAKLIKPDNVKYDVVSSFGKLMEIVAAGTASPGGGAC